MPTSQPLPTPAARLRAYVKAYEATSNLTEQITAISWLTEDGTDTTAPLLLDDLRRAAEALDTTEAMNPRVSGTVTQYGIRFPDGSVVWATDANAVTLHPDGLRVVPTITKAAVNGTYTMDLAKVVSGSDDGAARSHFYGQAEDLAETARIDPEEYLASLKIVRRTLVTTVGDYEPLEFEELAGESPSS